MRNFRRFSEWVLEMLFPQVYSFFLAGSTRSTLPSAHFVYRLPCYPRLSIFNWVSNVIDLILYVFCLFFYVYVSSFCAFLSFWALKLVGFLLFFFFYREAVFTSARFSLTANISHGTLGLALCLVGLHYAAASKWASSLVVFSWSYLVIFGPIELRGLLLIRGCFLRLPNCHGKNMTEPIKECDPKNNRTLWLGPA